VLLASQSLPPAATWANLAGESPWNARMVWLTQVGMLLAAALAGMTMPLQAGVNSQLGRALGHPLWAVAVSLLVSLAVTLPALLLLRLPGPTLAAAAAQPGWVWLGGTLGAFFLAVSVLLAPRMGAAGFIASVVAGQMLASLLLDHFALAGYEARPMSLWRLAGAALVVAGVLAMQMAPRE
jgi:transporter family-2 protein